VLEQKRATPKAGQPFAFRDRCRELVAVAGGSIGTDDQGLHARGFRSAIVRVEVHGGGGRQGSAVREVDCGSAEALSHS
jgi:hypothetical protein